MVTDEMAEIGGRAICERMARSWGAADDETRYRWKSMARAVLLAVGPGVRDAALEEAAKVADRCGWTDFRRGRYASEQDAARYDCADMLAAAIRALKGDAQ